MKADKRQATTLLKTAKGQIEGIIKMVDEDRYCIDIYNQVLAVQSLLKKVNKEILQAHMQSCVADAFEEGKEEEKINELLTLLDKITK